MPLSSEYGTSKTVTARLWPGLGQILALAFRYKSLKPFKSFPLPSEAVKWLWFQLRRVGLTMRLLLLLLLLSSLELSDTKVYEP